MYHRTSFALALIVFGIVHLSLRLEDPLFNKPHSTLLRDKNGIFLSSRIASDYQWRFPPVMDVPEKFSTAITLFEDKNFRTHIGFDPLAILRAFYLNIKNREVVSGGSTITMQVIRLSRGGRKRTFAEKIKEAYLAVKLELKYSKSEIMGYYASYAPFGGNVVGLDSASWRYYNRESSDLSWAEIAALAVLPNSPGLIYPGRNEEPFLKKRNRVLKKIFTEGYISKQSYELALQEPLPSKPKPLPDHTRHLLNRAVSDGYMGQELKTTIDLDMQINVGNIVENHMSGLRDIGVNNASVIVLDIESGNTLAYVGNCRPVSSIHSNSVDIISSARSTGSLLKPILYGLAIDDSLITPTGYIKDTPLYYKGFKPENYSYTFSGIVNADKALQMSLNIPFVNLLNEYDYTRFYDNLSLMGLKFENGADHYGLAMIIGGFESSLWDLASLYSSAARTLNVYNSTGVSTIDTYYPNKYIEEESVYRDTEYSYISPGALYAMFKTMTKLTRPDSVGNWEAFSSSYPISWKTGTSTGFKDAWAIGMTSKYLVGVWTGNADGEGRAGLVGVEAAAPILFDVFKFLPRTELFRTPVSAMSVKSVCSESGYLSGPNCSNAIDQLLPRSRNYKVCSFHKIVHLDNSESYQVLPPYPSYKMVNRPWLTFDPVTSWYYQSNNPAYIPPPPFLNSSDDVMEFIYPSRSSLIYVPIELHGGDGATIFEVAHRDKTSLYWHLDGKYLGKTESYHQMLLNPGKGKHKVTVIDNDGNEISRLFEIIK